MRKKAEPVDIMPTILDLAGIQSPLGVQGQSIKPLLSDENGAEGKECILAQDREVPELSARGVDPTGFKIKAVRTKEWKLIYYPDVPYGELYNLKNDPDEFENLWTDTGYSGIREEMRILLLDKLFASEDPLPRRDFHW